MALCQQAMTELDSVREQAAGILGTEGTGFGEISGAIEQAKAQADSLYSAMQEVESRLSDVAARHAQG